MTWKRVVFFLVAALALLAGAGRAQVRTIEGKAVTGINRRLGQPVFDLGPPFGTIGFDTAAAFNPAGSDPLPLTPASPAGTLLASTVDPFFLVVFNVPPDSIDPANLNVPLREVGVVTGFAGERSPLGDILESPQLAPGRAVTDGPITLGKWMAAKGTAKIRCTGAEAPRIDLEFSGLVPHGLYSAWGGMLTPQGPAPIPLGGVPNGFVADERGRGAFSARLNYCPLALKPGEVPLAFIDVVLHSDHALYGTVPELLAGGFPPGIFTQIQVEFAVSATYVP